MNRSDESLIPIAALIRGDSDNFFCRVRWLLGAGNRLPTPDAEFLVRLVLTQSNHEILRAIVQPKNHAMFDPPRTPEVIGPGISWQAATPPTKPVNLTSWQTKPADEGLGIYHLLCGPQDYRTEWLVSEFLRKPIAKRWDSSLAGLFSPQMPADEVASHLARVLVRGAHMPAFFPRVLPQAFEALCQLFSSASEPAELRSISWSEPGALLLPPTSRSTNAKEPPVLTAFRYAEFILGLMNDREFREQLDFLVAEPAKLRNQVRIGSLVGDRLIDYWCSPTASVPPDQCPEEQRGKTYAAAELLGQGVTLGDFTAAQLQQWVDQGDSLRVFVEHTATAAHTDGSTGDCENMPLCHFIDEPNADGLLRENSYLISGSTNQRSPGIRRALALGSSLPPIDPDEAECRITYNLMETVAGGLPAPSDPNKIERRIGFGTGDSKIEIKIGLIQQTADNAKNVAGFNVYGIWETDDTKTFFGIPDQKIIPDLAVLKKWLITKRYSYERDLKGAFTGLGALLFEQPSDYPLPSPDLDPRLLTIVDPPSLPSVERPKRVLDLQDDEEVSLETRPDQNWYTIDLRAGMDSGLEGQDRRFVGWDPEGAIRGNWSPEQSRIGEDTVATEGRPQRYRFWVTSFDSLGQEGTPIPVLTNDLDAGEIDSYEYSPRRRTAISPPLNPALVLSAARDQLTISFETPFLNEVGEFAARNPPQRVPREYLNAHILLYRVPLRGPVDEGRLRTRPSLGHLSTVYDLPTWTAFIEKATNLGWELLHTFMLDGNNIESDVWTDHFALDHTHRGYEYNAAIGVSVKCRSAWMPYWMPIIDSNSSAERSLDIVNASGQHQLVKVTEAPTVSAVVEPDQLPIPNPEEPRATSQIGPTSLVRARHILPPPGIPRDLVLMRLLTLPFGEDPSEWRDTGVKLTFGKSNVLDAALDRAIKSLASPISIDDESLRFARTILANDFLGDSSVADRSASEVPDYKQLLVMGFRGLVLIDSSYMPGGLQSNEAAAVKWVLHHTRVEHDRTDAFSSATYVGDATLHSNTATTAVYQINGSNISDALRELIEGNNPCLVQLGDAADPNASPEYAELTNIESGNLLRVHLAAFPSEITVFPNEVTLSFHLAEVLLEEPIPPRDIATQLRQYLPVGGGPNEAFCWWLGTASAEGKQSLPQNRRVVFHQLQRTIPPVPPTLLRCDSPLQGDGCVLDPATFGQWTPDDLRTLSDARQAPRNVVSWISAYRDPDEKILLERREKLVGTQRSNSRAAVAELTPWKAILQISSIQESASLTKELVEAIRDNWLMGEVIATDDHMSTDLDVHFGFPNSPNGHHLETHQGIRLLAIREGESPRPAVIDYYLHNKPVDSLNVANGNLKYAYRASSYVILDVPEGTPPIWTYLLSEPTPWTGYFRPDTSTIEITEVAKTENDVLDLGPSIRFEFTAPLNKRWLGESEHDWRFGVSVRRLRRFSLHAPSKHQDPGSVEVGESISVWPGTTKEIVDSDIEREDADTLLTVEYDIYVVQFKTEIVGGVRQERQIRSLSDEDGDGKADPFRISVPIASASEQHETAVIVHLSLK